MRRALRGGSARSPEYPGKCRREGISGRRCGRGACPWLCRPRPFLLRPVFRGRCSGKLYGPGWRRYLAPTMEFTLATERKQMRNKGGQGAKKRAWRCEVAAGPGEQFSGLRADIAEGNLFVIGLGVNGFVAQAVAFGVGALGQPFVRVFLQFVGARA